jgi:hypothetical protein
MGMNDPLSDVDDDFPSIRAEEQLLLETLLSPSTKPSPSTPDGDSTTGSRRAVAGTRSRVTSSQPCTCTTAVRKKIESLRVVGHHQPLQPAESLALALMVYLSLSRSLQFPTAWR